MPSDIVIRVENLSKRYEIGRASTRLPGDGLRHALESAVSAPLRWLKAKSEARLPFRNPQSAIRHSEAFYALRDVSFEVRRGEVLGIIGRNGAGKSTLLKILSRITEPSSGRIGLKGRVASLLEVGTGFHPELTGRENIYLNGAILGMTRAEVRRKFDEIVEFAGVEKFLDTPVKHYSSGMYVRLAFAVAAHLEPEILIVDEVLAVGDAEFQKKCLGKMKDVAAGEGRTVLFVSHNMSAVEILCDAGLFLEEGEVGETGPISVVLEQYRRTLSLSPSVSTALDHARSSSTGYCIKKLSPVGESFAPREEMLFSVEIDCPAEGARCHFSMHIQNDRDENVTTVSTEYLENTWILPGRSSVMVKIQTPWLLPGAYRVNAFIYEGGILDSWSDACRFEVGSNVATHGFSLASSRNAGKVLCEFEFKTATEGLCLRE